VVDEEEYAEGNALDNLAVMTGRLYSALAQDNQVKTSAGMSWYDGLVNEQKRLADGFPNRLSKIDLAKAEVEWATAIADAILKSVDV